MVNAMQARFITGRLQQEIHTSRVIVKHMMTLSNVLSMYPKKSLLQTESCFAMCLFLGSIIGSCEVYFLCLLLQR